MRQLSKVGILKKAGHKFLKAVSRPATARKFVREIANTIVDFGDEPFRLTSISLSQVFSGIDQKDFPLTIRPPKSHELPLEEYCSIAVLVQHLKPSIIFEIGTHKGRTTRLIAESVDGNARIYTLDLPQSELEKGECFSESNRWIVGQEFLNAPCASKITQFYGDTKRFNFSPFDRAVDLVFVDADHSYESARSDSLNAFRMIRSGGMIIWDDYHPVYGPGVMEYLHELAREVEIFRISGTRLAFYRAK